MAFCEECGTQLSDTARFCSACGKAVGAVVGSPSVPSRRSPRATRLILSAVALLALVGAGSVFYLTQSTRRPVGQANERLPDVAGTANRAPSADRTTQSAVSPTASVVAPIARLDDNKRITAADGQCALFTK